MILKLFKPLLQALLANPPYFKVQQRLYRFHAMMCMELGCACCEIDSVHIGRPTLYDPGFLILFDNLPIDPVSESNAVSHPLLNQKDSEGKSIIICILIMWAY